MPPLEEGHIEINFPISMVHVQNCPEEALLHETARSKDTARKAGTLLKDTLAFGNSVNIKAQTQGATPASLYDHKLPLR